jgi:hypothetical protein
VAFRFPAQAAFFAAFHLAHRKRWAAAIFLRAAADSIRFCAALTA